MSYGDHTGPNKPNKGHEGGACNRTLCQDEPALNWNHGSSSWYCDRCARDIARACARDTFVLNLGHPMFETREQMDARTNKGPAK